MDTSSSAPKKITLYRGFPPTNEHAWSPFVIKLEFRLRHARVKYESLEGRLSEAPMGKVPYLDISTLTSVSSGGRELVSDSSVIIEPLTRLGAVSDLNAGLNPEQKLADLSIRGMCEEKLYFLGMSERWIQNYYIHRDKILVSKPWILRFIIGNLIHRKVAQTLHLQGCGRFSFEEQRKMRHDTWQTIEDALAGSRSMKMKEGGPTKTPFWYFGGEDPSEVDAVLFAFICSVLVTRSCPDSRKFVRSLPVVMDYGERIHDVYFPDYEKWEVV